MLRNKTGLTKFMPESFFQFLFSSPHLKIDMVRFVYGFASCSVTVFVKVTFQAGSICVSYLCGNVDRRVSMDHHGKQTNHR